MPDHLRNVADIIGDAPAPAPAPIDLPGFPGPRIVFGMPEEQYHAIPALSNSGIKSLLVSPMDFWARSWMNPLREDMESDAMALGTAFHARICEGRDAFYQRYAVALDQGDYPDALVTMDQLREACEARGLKAAKSKAETQARLLEHDPAIQCWDALVADHEAENVGRIMLPAKMIARIEIAAAMIEKHPALAKAFTGGFPEVSIFWVCAETGVPMKARLDYLKLRAIVDLKTFANQQDKPIDRAVAYTVAQRKYHIQPAVYGEAVAAAKAMLRAEPGAAVFVGDGPHPTPDWLASWVKAEDPAFMFVFQQTGVAPVARGYVFPRANA